MTDGWMAPRPEGWEEAVERAMSEDVGNGDVSASLLPEELHVDWYIESQASGILCGAGIAVELLGAKQAALQDGSAVAPKTLIASDASAATSLLTCERTAMNFLMHLSGIATLTNQFVRAVEGTKARIVDTRKTTPGLRALEKYAVRCGGGHNHRMGLYDGVMIKDNHIRALGGITGAIKTARQHSHHLLKIEVECETLDQVSEALAAGADVVMLDNMDTNTMARAVAFVSGACLLEASGGVNLTTVREIAETGVDFISVGAITHSAPALPFHLEVR